jgi:hypothetical protein
VICDIRGGMCATHVQNEQQYTPYDPQDPLDLGIGVHV